MSGSYVFINRFSWRIRMRLFLVLILSTFLFSQSHRHSRQCYNYNTEKYHSKHWDSIDFDEYDFVYKRYGDKIRIDDEYRLFINGKKISLNAKETRLLRRYVTMHDDVIEFGIEIGKSGAKIGVESAKLGLSAAGMALKMVFADGDEDDFEERIERMTRRIERKAEKLEEDAELIEEAVEEIAELSCELKQRIPELRDFRYF